MIPSNPSIVRKVAKQQLRDIWNDPRFQSILLRSTTQRVDVYEGLAPPDAGQEEGTLSYVYDLMDNPNDQLLGTFHVYKRPDGGIGASGLPDPIFLLVDGIPMCDP
jgi:hypothetical protein